LIFNFLDKNSIQEEIKDSLNLGNVCYYSELLVIQFTI
jgi:hypothetical protein